MVLVVYWSNKNTMTQLLLLKGWARDLPSLLSVKLNETPNGFNNITKG